MFWGFAAYVMWGFFPSFFPFLEPATPLEILAHRFIWTLVFMLLVMLLLGRLRDLTRIAAKDWGLVALASVLVSLNWGLYIYAVNSGHVADAALGYFINPLVSVVLAVVLLRESLRRLQLVSVLIAAVAVIILTVALGQPPIISLGLAFSFGFYGLVKKRVRLEPFQSLTAETLVLAPVGVAYLIFLGDASTFTTHGMSHAGLLMAAGVVTALPLLCFARAAHEMSLVSLGMIQYLTPIMQILWAILVKHESIPAAQWAGFIIIWVAVAVFVADLVLHHRRGRSRLTPVR